MIRPLVAVITAFASLALYAQAPSQTSSRPQSQEVRGSAPQGAARVQDNSRDQGAASAQAPARPQSQDGQATGARPQRPARQRPQPVKTYDIKALLLDESTGEPLSFATVSLTRDGQSKAYKYNLSNEQGEANFEDVRRGKYQFKAEILGYISHSQTVDFKGEAIDLGTIKLKLDAQTLEEAKVSALAREVVIKKDTVEYNATAFRTTENDVLEDLLKKLPGVEVSDDGKVTVNGESVSKITIDGKTFFLDDPQMASKNIPAKLVNKLKVIKKKSEQAEFTGIDDGQEETVIDLSVKPGMMNGLMGNILAGAGRDIPSERNTLDDVRYTGNAFIGRFDQKTQISLILNGNNTNNEGSTNRSGNMMAGMMGGGRGGMGGGGGINSSYMAGANIAGNFLDGNMEAGGNYIFNSSDRISSEQSSRTSYLPGGDRINNKDSQNTSSTLGHNIGLRLEHKFSKNTSILFQPQVNFGTGGYSQISSDTTYLSSTGPLDKLNEAYTRNLGGNRNVSAGGFLLFRQRLGLPGRTLTALFNANFSNNVIEGSNYNYTDIYSSAGTERTTVDQYFDNTQRSSNYTGTITYTEPLGDHFYIEGNYSYSRRSSTSKKNTFDSQTKEQDFNYSNEIINTNDRQDIGVNALYQSDVMSAQVGFAAMPNRTYNSTTRFNTETSEYTPREYEDFQWNFSPRVMIFARPSDSHFLRLRYNGNSSQPSTSQLMPVPDNTDPLNMSFGNPTLRPYFSHSLNGNYSYTNRERFSSINVRFNGSYVNQPIVNTIWYSARGGQYSMPMNGPASANFGLNFTGNFPLGKSKFSLSTTTGGNWSRSGSFIGNDIDMSVYENDGYYAFMEDFLEQMQDKSWYGAHITQTTTKSFNINEMLRLVYRGEYFEAAVRGRTAMRSSWYDGTGTMEQTTTWNNTLSAEFTWNWEEPGISLDSDFNYRWYNGYTTPQEPQALLNASISKLLFGNTVNLTLTARDILGQGRNLSVSDSANYHSESITNTLGRYIILSLTWRFGTMGGQRSGGRGPGARGMHGGHGGGAHGPVFVSGGRVL